MSNTIAGVIGAMITLGVIGLVGLVVLFVMRGRRTTEVAPIRDDKGSISSQGSCV